jgi:enediyne biosynthesis protein E3
MLFSSSPLRQLRKSFLGISLAETTFTKRGFYQGDLAAQQRLERIGATFAQGYNTALEDDRFEVLVPALQKIERELQGFAFEGASMALALLDYLLPLKKRLAAFLEGAGADHIYMVHVGAGWTLGRLPRSAPKMMQQFDPLLRWLVVDGYGFHQGFFSWPRFIDQQIRPAHLSEAAQHVFDQGLGRSLWFVKGADFTQCLTAINAFSAERRGDLWSGIGLACAYAGGVEEDALPTICRAAGENRWQLAQGAAFAAKARQRAGNPAAHTNLASHVFCGCSDDAAASLTDECIKDLPQGDQAYATWRSRIRIQLATQNVQV